MNWWKKAALTAATVVFFVLVWGLLHPPESPVDRIRHGCEREFGDRGQEAVNQCRLKLSIDELNAAEEERYRRAAR